MHRLFPILLGALIANSPAFAQQPIPQPPPPDSLNVVGQVRQATDTALLRRVEQAEKMIQLLRTQVSEQSRGKVEPRAGNRIELGGMVLMNGFYNNAKTNNSDLPLFVVPPDPPTTTTLPASGAGGTARQTRLTLTATVPQLLGGSFTGELDADFFGGQLAFGRLFPLLHLRRVRGEIQWKNAWVMFGQDAPPILELNPSSLAAMGEPLFVTSGNLWFWMPQIRVGAEGGMQGIRAGVEVAALAPGTAESTSVFFTQLDRAERSKRPFAQGRVRIRWDRPNTTGELSVGAHYGWLSNPSGAANQFTISKGAAASLRVGISHYAELRGEAFVGQAFAVLGGGGVAQNLGPGDQPVHTKGGWAQLNVTPTPEWEVGGGYGQDDPRDTDLLATTARLKNRTMEGHIHWKPKPLLVGAAFRRHETTYGSGVLKANHVNLAVGFEF